MRKILLCAAIMFAFSSAIPAYGFSSKGEDCAKCHTLKKEEAASLLKGVIPNVSVLSVRITPLKAMWEVDFESNGQKGIVYIYFSKKHLVSGSIIDIVGMKNLTQERFAELTKVDVSKVPLKDAIVMGSKKAKHKVIVFTDPD